MDRCRVLVVDDSPSDLRHIERLLHDSGFDVVTATGPDAAMTIVRQQYFHVAVIDARLDASAPDNRDGMALMYELRRIAPTMPVILLHENPPAEMVREALRPQESEPTVFNLAPRSAYDFLRKNDADLLQIPRAVQQAFDRIVRANLELKIIDTQGVLANVDQKLRFADVPRPDPVGLASEIRTLMQKLFAEWDMVEIKPIDTNRRGYSRALVFLALPQQPGVRRGESCVVKIAEHTLIEKEVLRHRNRVHMTVRRSARALDPVVRTRALGGVVYSFVGLGDKVRDFAEFYQSENFSQIEQAVRNLFQETLLPLHGSTSFIRPDTNPRHFFMKLLRLQPEELYTTLETLIGETGSILTRSTVDPRFLRLGMRVRLPDPVQFALETPLPTDYKVAVIHGDLHVHNVLVDQHSDTWLIDFANSDDGPLLQDYVTFEVSVMIELTDEITDWEPFYEWAALLLADFSPVAPPLPPHLAELPQLVRAHTIIGVVRQLARETRPLPSERTYLIAILFTALRMMTVKFLTPAKSFHALILAAVAAQALS